MATPRHCLRRPATLAQKLVLILNPDGTFSDADRQPVVGNAAAVVSQDPLDHRDFVRIEAGVQWGDDRLVSMA